MSLMNSDYAIDIAIEILGDFFAKECHLANGKSTDPKLNEEAEARIDLLRYEMDVVYGLKGDEMTRRSVFDKIDKYYAPLLKNEITR